ncbi:MAG: HU family DNA-binding protein, partial [Bacteroidaceae bacterium]|nr:HU family DNA-binding protein [Bacteroidaceae bacterium]
MTKSDIVNEIARKTGVEKNVVISCVEAFTSTVAESLINGNP